MSVNFWLAYWAGAYSHLLGLNEAGLRFVNFDALCAEPPKSIAALAQELGGADAFEQLKGAAATFHPAVRYDPENLGIEPALLGQAREIHGMLAVRAIN